MRYLSKTWIIRGAGKGRVEDSQVFAPSATLVSDENMEGSPSRRQEGLRAEKKVYNNNTLSSLLKRKSYIVIVLDN